MKSKSHLFNVLVVASALAFPGESAAQTVCEGFSTVLKAMTRYRDRKKLEFYTLPGATCERRVSSYICIWSRPRPHASAGATAFRRWHARVLGEMKNLAGAFQRCIDQEQVPYEWNSIKRKKTQGYVTKYSVFTERRPKLSVVLCIRLGDLRLPENQDHTGASLSLAFHKRHSDHCGVLY